MLRKIGIALLFYGSCVCAMDQVESANAVAVKCSRDLKVISYDVPRRYERIVKDIDGADIRNGWGLKIWDNVEGVLSELIASGVSKSIRYLDIKYGMTSSVFRKLTDFNCLEYLILKKCFLGSSDLSLVPPCVKFLDLSECLPLSGKLDTLNLSLLRSNDQLQFLSLAGVTLGQKDVADLSLLKSLKYLDLSYSNFTAAIYKMRFPDTKLNIIDDREAADVYGGDVS